jgi:DNA mismatch repair protein MutS
MTIEQLDHEALTPLMKQYVQIKSNYTDTLVFFQVGDFYELFWEDAKVASAFLAIALTKRGTYKDEPIPLCGVPVHALDHYLNKLVKGGFKVALCDQMEEPRPGVIVRRAVTQVLTPGTLTDVRLLDDKSPSYLMSFFPMQDSWGLLFGELLTARLFGTVLPARGEKALDAELIRFIPDEVVVPADAANFRSFFSNRGYFTSIVDTQLYEQAPMDQWVAQFSSESRKNFESHAALQKALYYFYLYVRKNQEGALAQFNSLQLYAPDEFLILDSATVRNLELVKNSFDGGRAHTLFETLDGACTAMGSRTIKNWLTCPRVDRASIEQRYDAIEAIMSDVAAMQQLHELITSIGDLERLVGRIALNRALVPDYCMLMRTLAVMPKLRALLRSYNDSSLLNLIEAHLHDFDAIVALLRAALNDDQSQACVIKKGYDETLDSLKDLVAHAQQLIVELEVQEQQKTGINSLKIRYNQIYGYSIEITKTNLHLVPQDYTRQQSLVGKERYTMPALQKLEHDIRYAENAIKDVEDELYARIKKEVAGYLHMLRATAYALSRLDALYGLAAVAYEHGYVRPELCEGRDIVIQEGRHAVVERTLEHKFIPNDTHMTDAASFWLITGPNMGGKSTYLRQVALICIMAQAGSFVPARAVRLPILDRIFTRIGAGDNLAEGKSTFLVEMEETALICTQATERSLVILDEVGRGTSTFDGLAIAQAVVEHLFLCVKARCLFATHYHELTLLRERFAGIENYHAGCTKTANGIIFLYKMLPGVADGSFGVEVAKLACLPPSIVGRAEEILQVLAQAENTVAGTLAKPDWPEDERLRPAVVDPALGDLQQKVFMLEQKLKEQEEVLRVLHEVNVDDLSPKKAFDLIWLLKNR